MTHHGTSHRQRLPSVFVLLALGAWLLGLPAPASAQQGWSGVVSTVSAPVSGYPGPVRVATDAAGDVIVVWPQGGLIRTARYMRTAGSWSETVDLGSAPSHVTPGIGIDSEQNATVAWASVNGINAARYSAVAGTWGTAVSVAPAAFPGDPGVGVDARGNVTTVWGDSGRIKVARYSEAGQMWSVPVDISDGYLPQLAVDDAGNAIVVSSRGAIAAGAVRAMRYSVISETWSSMTELAAVQQLARTPQIATDAAGNAVAVWSGYSTGPTFVVQAAIFAAATGVWGNVITLGPAATPPSGGPELAVAATSQAVVAWSAPGGLARASRFSMVTQTWSSATDVSASGVGAEVWDVAITASGLAIALWTEADRLVHAAWNSTASAAWTTPVSISMPGVVSFYPRAAVDASGGATVVWGVGLSPCPPGCVGALQTTRWVGSPAAPTIAAVRTGSGTLAIGFVAPPTIEAIYEPTNYEYSTDDGTTWTARTPASTVTPLRIVGLANGVAYPVRIRAVNAAGPGLGSVAVTSTPAPAPDAPVGLHVAAQTGHILRVAWTASLGGVPPTGYVLEGGMHPGEVLASIPTSGIAPSFTFTAPPGVFYVRLHAIAGAAWSEPSNETRIFVNVSAPPSAPASLLGLANGSSVALSWVNTFAGGAPTSLWLNVTGAISAVLPLPFGEAFTFAGVPPGTYTLSVIAANASGASAPSNTVTLTFPEACTGVPAAPVNLQAWRAGSTIYVSWSPPASGPAVTSYTVQVGGAFVGGFRTTGRTLSGVAGPGTYTLSVVGENVCGTGVATPEQTIVVP
jgi:hypothetical protein